jgi:FkbM family methyltransferase
LFVILRVCLRFVWPLTWPIRWYWLHSNRQFGKKLLIDHVLKRMLPAPPAGFYADVPCGGRVFVHHREDIGLAVLLSGSFEKAELAFAVEQTPPGSVAIDVGANIGMFAIPLARAVGRTGHVIAIEPSPENACRLEQNVQLNALANVTVEPIAVAETQGSLLLQLASDPGFHSTTTAADFRGTNEEIIVRAETLDRLWQSRGEPHVSLIKLDTEGGECAALRSASLLLSRCHPIVLVEAKDRDRARELDDWLSQFNYTRTRPRGFCLGNLAYIAAPVPTSIL